MSEGLALALDWNISYDKIVFSDSKGKVRVLDPERSLEGNWFLIHKDHIFKFHVNNK